MSKSKSVLTEIARRQKQAEEAAKRPQFSITDFCFDKQLAFVQDPAKFKTAVCSRRAGKSHACIADMYHTAKSFPAINVVYITLNRRSAKRIIWRELTTLISQYEINADGSPNCQINNTELSITLNNKSTIFLAGADDEGEIDKFRGLAIKKVYIDEAQSFRSYIKELVNDVLVPALYDYDGSLILIGTPGPVPNGYFYDASNNPSWAHHHWTVYDNPWISRKSGKPVSEIIATANARRGINESHPTHLRENLGIWVKDPNSLVFAFDPALNTFDSLTQTQLDDMQFIFGIDIGWKDADAIAVIGYNFTEKVVYLVEELITSKQTISDLVNQIKALQSKYKPIKMVMDAGALGKKIQEEILQRYGLFIEAAEKQRKLEFIELMNDDLRTRRLKVFSGSRFAEDAWRVEWDRDGSKQKVSDRFHTDIGDALLYGWRESRHYQAEPLIPDPVKDSEDYMRMLEERDAEALMQAKNRTNIDDIAPDQSLMDSLFDDDLTGFDD